MVSTSRLRVDFLKQAVERAENDIANNADEMGTEVDEVRRYFEWVKNGICPEDRLELSQRISGLSRKRKPLAGRP